MRIVTQALVRRALPFAAFLVLSVTFCIAMLDRLATNLDDPQRAVEFADEDSLHYLRIADAFVEGRLADTVRPAHRQPLFPALLAAARASGADTSMGLGAVNVLVGLATLAVLLGAGWWLFGSWWIGLAGGIAYAANEFVHVHVADELLTEPLFVLVAVVAVVAAFKYLDASLESHLALAAAAAGLAYLARPNGLFLFVAMCITLLARDLLRHAATGRTAARPPGFRIALRGDAARSILRRYALALLVFVVVAAPSWVTRTAVYGNPVHHGYLSNYLWVDTYEEGHQSEVIYGPRHYFASHGPGDVLYRIAWGIGRVFVVAPTGFGWSGFLCHVAAMGGLLAAAVMRRPAGLFLAAFMLLQAGPLIWTAMANPGSRVHYGALLPFLLLYVMILVDLARRHFARYVDAACNP